MNEIELTAAVLSILQKEIAAVLGDCDILQDSDMQLKENRTEVNAQITLLKQEIVKNRGFLRGLYENLITGILTSEEYFMLKAGYEAKISAAGEKITGLENGRKELEAQTSRYSSLTQDAKTLAENNELTAVLVDRLIERIIIYHDKRIEVSFTFQSGFEGLKEGLAYA